MTLKGKHIMFDAKERRVLARAAAILAEIREKLPSEDPDGPWAGQAVAEGVDLDCGLAEGLLDELAKTGRVEAT